VFRLQLDRCLEFGSDKRIQLRSADAVSVAVFVTGADLIWLAGRCEMRAQRGTDRIPAIRNCGFTSIFAKGFA
jgi:hypothetical protein